MHKHLIGGVKKGPKSYYFRAKKTTFSFLVKLDSTLFSMQLTYIFMANKKRLKNSLWLFKVGGGGA